GLANRARLVLAESHDDDLAGFKDRTDAHGNRLVGHIFFAEKAGRGIPASDWIERHAASPAGPRGPRLVEANVPGSADAQHLQVNAADFADELLVTLAIIIDLFFWNGPIGDVNVLRSNVHMTKERLLHPAVVTVNVVLGHRVVFVQVKRDYPREIE